MRSAIRASGFAAVLAMLAGCRMCASPYDYCGPTYGVEDFEDGCGEGGVGCSLTDRRGSILSAGGHYGGEAWSDGAVYSDGQAMPQQGDVIYEGEQVPAQAVPNEPPAESTNEAMRPTPDPRMSRRPVGPGPAWGEARTRFVR